MGRFRFKSYHTRNRNLFDFLIMDASTHAGWLTKAKAVCGCFDNNHRHGNPQILSYAQFNCRSLVGQQYTQMISLFVSHNSYIPDWSCVCVCVYLLIGPPIALNTIFTLFFLFWILNISCIHNFSDLFKRFYTQNWKEEDEPKSIFFFFFFKFDQLLLLPCSVSSLFLSSFEINK